MLNIYPMLVYHNGTPALSFIRILLIVLQSILLSTTPALLVEASPYDRIWGIGLPAGDRRALNKDTWLGENLLGYALTKVRDLYSSNKV